MHFKYNLNLSFIKNKENNKIFICKKELHVSKETTVKVLLIPLKQFDHLHITHSESVK